MAQVLELIGLTKHYHEQAALDRLDLSIPEGEFFSLLGPSGCGKTTTLRLIAGFEEPTAGDVLLRGRSLKRLRPYERNVSTVFQNYALFPHLTARENIEFGLRHRRNVSAADAAARVNAVMEMLQIPDKARRKPAELSGGEKQRVALARSLVLEPEVLLLDEPLSALDPNLRKQVRAELKALQRRVGITFLFITHDQEEALSMSDRIAVLNAGRLEQAGTPRELYLQPSTRFTASFLGPVNWVNGVGVRPEATQVAHGAPPLDARALPATVENAVFLGNCIHVETRLATGEQVVAEVSRFNGTFRQGELVHVWWREGDELAL
jgi:ABC-type Fe3+/spermidine/putrescine transport system ATPase subunit